MYQGWKYSTIIFALQTFLGVLVWLLTKDILYFMAIFAALAVVLAIPGIAFIIAIITNAVIFFAAASIAFAFVALGLLGIMSGIVISGAFGAFGVLIIVIAYVYILIAVSIDTHEGGAQEPTWALMLAMMPAGIGTVIGGTAYYLFFRQTAHAKLPEQKTRSA